MRRRRADNKPGIDLPVQAVCCRVHGEPFRAAWPSGYLGFALTVVKLSLETSDTLKEVTGGDARRLNGVIAEFGPLCSLVTPEQRRECYQTADHMSVDWATIGVCASCRKWARGATGLYSPRPNLPALPRHVCFDCSAGQDCQT